MTASEWVIATIAALGILGTLAATVLAQWGEAKRSEKTARLESGRRTQERSDALARERREAVRADYRDVLRFVSSTRLFALELRKCFAEIEDWTQSGATDDREVSDL